jgi:hypothetical protein
MKVRKAASQHHQLGDAPIEQKHHAMMNALAHELDEMFNGDARGNDRKNGFILMVFPFHGADGRANYISNAERADVVTMLKEQLARFEGQPEMTGRA